MTLRAEPPGRWPDLPDREPSPILCRCLLRTHYAANTNRYVCPLHGPVVADEALPPRPPGNFN